MSALVAHNRVSKRTQSIAVCDETLHKTSVLVECRGSGSCFFESKFEYLWFSLRSCHAVAVSVFENGVLLVKRVIIRFICVPPRFVKKNFRV